MLLFLTLFLLLGSIFSGAEESDSTFGFGEYKWIGVSAKFVPGYSYNAGGTRGELHYPIARWRNAKWEYNYYPVKVFEDVDKIENLSFVIEIKRVIQIMPVVEEYEETVTKRKFLGYKKK